MFRMSEIALHDQQFKICQSRINILYLSEEIC